MVHRAHAHIVVQGAAARMAATSTSPAHQNMPPFSVLPLIQMSIIPKKPSRVQFKSSQLKAWHSSIPVKSPILQKHVYMSCTTLFVCLRHTILCVHEQAIWSCSAAVVVVLPIQWRIWPLRVSHSSNKLWRDVQALLRIQSVQTLTHTSSIDYLPWCIFYMTKHYFLCTAIVGRLHG